MNIICLVLDRFNIRFAGPYGCSLDLTPALDELAGESVLFDWYFTNSLDLKEIYRQFWQERDPNGLKTAVQSNNANSNSAFPEQKDESILLFAESSNGSKEELFGQFRQAGYETALITDDPTVYELAEKRSFDNRIFMKEDPAPSFSRAEDDTHLFHLFSEFGTQINRYRKQASPFFIWGHFKGFGGSWDFPLESEEQKDDSENHLDERKQASEEQEEEVGKNLNESENFPQDESDFETDSDCEADFISENGSDAENITKNSEFENIEKKPGSNGVPFYRVKTKYTGRTITEFPIDLKEKLNDLYSKGVEYLDTLLEGLLNFLIEEKILDNTLLIFAGSRGLPLGEHLQAGVSKEDPEPLYFESVHQPLMMRFPDGRYETVRVQGICSPSDVCETLRGIVLNDSERGLIPLAQEKADQIHTELFISQKGADSKTRALVNENWYLIRNVIPAEDEFDGQKKESVQYELYTNPFDRWNVNDVSDRCEETVNELSKKLEDDPRWR